MLDKINTNNIIINPIKIVEKIQISLFRCSINPLKKSTSNPTIRRDKLYRIYLQLETRFC